MDFKNIHIGKIVKMKVAESGIEISRICNFLNCTVKEIEDMYLANSFGTELLLRWSKLLEYDFFRIYSQHLILYSPQGSASHSKDQPSQLPRFRKNIYTREIIDFILEQISSEKMTRKEVIARYNIPKTTLYKWINKYNP